MGLEYPNTNFIVSVQGTHLERRCAGPHNGGMVSDEEKRRLIEGYVASGMTRREYCSGHGIAVSTLDYWRLKQKQKPKLVRVAIKGAMDPQQAGPGFTLTLGNGRRIESSWSFAEADLTRLIRAVEA